MDENPFDDDNSSGPEINNEDLNPLDTKKTSDSLNRRESHINKRPSVASGSIKFSKTDESLSATTNEPPPKLQTIETIEKKGSVKFKTDITEHLLSLSVICEKYNVKVNIQNPSASMGLSEEDALTYRLKFGSNTIKKAKRKNGFFIFIEAMANLFNVILIGAGIINLVLYGVSPEENFANCYIGIILITVAFLNTFIEFWRVHKIAVMVSSYRNLVPQKSLVIRNHDLKQIISSELVPGDLIYIKFGDIIPADSIIFHSTDLKMDNSTLTGENDAINITPVTTTQKEPPPPQADDPTSQSPSKRRPSTLKRLHEEPPIPADAWEAPNLVFSGCVAVSGEGFGIVLRTGEKTVFGQISRLVNNEKGKKSPMSREIKRFCKLITMLAGVTSILFFFIAWARGRSFNYSLHFAVGILLAFIPQGLPITVTMLLAFSGQRMGKLNVLIKDLYGVETLGAITMLCTDKTGTITKNEMTVTNIWVNSQMYFCGPNKDDVPAGEKMVRMEIGGVGQILHIAATCTRARFQDPESSDPTRKIIGDPTDSGLLKWTTQRLKNISRLPTLYPKIFEIPFTSDTKTHLTIHRKSHKDGGLTLHIKGAPEIILALCSSIFIDAAPAVIQSHHRNACSDAYAGMAAKGHRVLGFAQFLLPGVKYPDNYRFSVEKKNWPMMGYTFLGMVSLEDPPKDGVQESISKMKTAGIKVVMVTGDHAFTAEAVARKVGLITGKTRQSIAKEKKTQIENIKESEYQAEIINGDRIGNLSEDDWDSLFLKDELIFARTSPKQKLEIVTRAQAMGHIVGVTGDGVNDAAALKKADLGIAMNITGSDISKDAAKMILMDDNFSTIVSGIFEGRLIFVNLKKCIKYTLTHIMSEIIPYLLFVLVPIPLTLTAVQILVIDLGFEVMTTLSFGWEPEEYDGMLMRLQPRRPVTKETVQKLRLKEEEMRQKLSSLERLDKAGSLDLGSIPLLNINDDDHPSADDDAGDFRLTRSRWQTYFQELKLMTRKKYWLSQYYNWKDLVNKSPEERLVDPSVLSWAYLEGGIIEFGGALVTFFVILYYSFGMDMIDSIIAQKKGQGNYRSKVTTPPTKATKSCGVRKKRV